MATNKPCTNLQACMKCIQIRKTNHLALPPNRSNRQHIIKGIFILTVSQDESGPGKSASVQIYSCTVVDPRTGKGKLSENAYLKQGKSWKHGSTKTITYKIKLCIEPEFGIPGAFLIANQHKHKFFLESASLEVLDNQTIHFDCRSWVYPVKKTKSERLFFSNASYLPNQTPSALVELRKTELVSLRGDGTGERKEWDRIYDYDYYNDLGNPEKGQEHIRPVLGGSRSRPYPCRGRTGRPPSNADSLSESQPEMINLDVYVPPDERFSPKKLSEFISHAIQASVHFLIPEAKSLLKQDSSSFESFDELHDMFSGKRSQMVDGEVKNKLKKLVPNYLNKKITHASKEDPVEFPLPQIIKEDELAWRTDEEFGRQMIAGINPTRIKRLQKFPPEGRYGMSTIQESDIQHNLEDWTVQETIEQWRLFILDHHDYLVPFLNRINSNGVCAYASRTLLFLKSDATLNPIAIELSLPVNSNSEDEANSADQVISWVFWPTSQGTQAALWQLAKAHVAANDSAYHQLISHWLNTHAVVEPFIIATKRQLSIMHPVYRLLDPHFKDTMHINALFRSIIINSGGVLEKILFSGEVSMQLSSELYKEWRFDEQALTADLLKRGLAWEDAENPDNPIGIELLFDDYPYGKDGLDIWCTIKTWVTEFCSIFYKDDDSVKSDVEIQAWWSEIQNVGHGDKCNETWWYQMTTLSNLIEALSTLIWIASALHASTNFGQYAYASYPPNRPTLCRKFVPQEGTFEFAEFLKDPDKYYLNMLPARFETTLGMALIEVLSRHTSDDVFLGQRPTGWTDNKEVQQKFEKFSESLQKIEKKILERNRNLEFKNRCGPSKIPYVLLNPKTSSVVSKGGITGQGIPNSISI